MERNPTGYFGKRLTMNDIVKQKKKKDMQERLTTTLSKAFELSNTTAKVKVHSVTDCNLKVEFVGKDQRA